MDRHLLPSRTGEAEALARNAAAEGFQTIVAAGGDGTIHEVVNGPRPGLTLLSVCCRWEQ